MSTKAMLTSSAVLAPRAGAIFPSLRLDHSYSGGVLVPTITLGMNPAQTRARSAASTART